MRLGFSELLVILAIILVICGGTQLPKLAHSIGKSKRILDEELNTGDSAQQIEEDNEKTENE